MINKFCKDKKKITYFFLLAIILILNTKIIIGATNNTILPPFPTNPQAVGSQDVTNIIIQENIKTRMEIKQYCDQKIATMIETVKTEGASIIGQNFVEFDRRIHETAQKLFIKMIIAVFTTILLACLVYYIIKRRIEKKHMPKAMVFKEVAITPTKTGIIAQAKQPELQVPIPTQSTPQSAVIQPSNITQEQQQMRELPTFPELQQPMILSPREREKIIREQEEVDKKRRKEAENKLAKLIDEHNRNRKHHLKLKKKLSKPQEEYNTIQQEHEILQKQIDDISRENNLPVIKGDIKNV